MKSKVLSKVSSKLVKAQKDTPNEKTPDKIPLAKMPTQGINVVNKIVCGINEPRIKLREEVVTVERIFVPNCSAAKGQ